MGVEVLANEAALAARAADIVCDLVRSKPESVLGLPTGTTPISTYFELGRRVDNSADDFRQATVFAVDEFLGAERTTAGTNSAFFKQYLRIPFKALLIPNPAAQDPDDHIRAFADAVRRAGGIDLCLLGIGANGHVAFNEPGSERDSRARVVDLAPETREAHAQSFGSLGRVPPRGLTLGIADLLETRALVVMALGREKAAIVARALSEDPSSAVPASWLREHDNVTWLLDEDAAAELRKS